MIKMIRRSVPVFLGLILGACLLSFAYASYFQYEFPSDDSYELSGDTSIMPLGYWYDSRYTTSMYTGDNIGIFKAVDGSYSLYAGTGSLSLGSNGLPSGSGLFQVPFASGSSAWTSDQASSVTNNVSDIWNGFFVTNPLQLGGFAGSLYAVLVDIQNTLYSVNSFEASINSGVASLHSDNTSLSNKFFSGNAIDASGVMGGIYSKLLDISNNTFSADFSYSGLNPIYKKLLGSSGSASFGYWISGANGFTELTANSLSDFLSSYIYADTANSILASGYYTLDSDGNYSSVSTNIGTPYVLSYGFSGLATILRGSSGSLNKATIWSFDEELNKEEKQVVFSNVLQALASIQSSIQQPLSQLQAVLANDEDLKLRQETQPQVDAVTDNFLGEGGSAPTPDDIGNMADWSNSMGDLFNSGVGAGQFFSSVTSSDSYSFFSQAVANDLDSTNAPVAISDDDYLSDYVLGDDGFYYLADNSFFSLESLMKGG